MFSIAFVSDSQIFHRFISRSGEVKKKKKKVEYFFFLHEQVLASCVLFLFSSFVEHSYFKRNVSKVKSFVIHVTFTLAKQMR